MLFYIKKTQKKVFQNSKKQYSTSNTNLSDLHPYIYDFKQFSNDHGGRRISTVGAG